MAFLSKLKKQKDPLEGLIDDEDSMEWDSPSDSEPEPEAPSAKAGFKVASIKLKQPADDEEEEEEEEEDGEDRSPGDEEEPDDEDTQTGSSEERLEGTKGDEATSICNSLLNIFEEELMDQRLESLNSWVEDVDAEELVGELNALMEEPERI